MSSQNSREHDLAEKLESDSMPAAPAGLAEELERMRYYLRRLEEAQKLKDMYQRLIDLHYSRVKVCD